MYSETMSKIGEAAAKNARNLRRSPFGYLIAAMLAGIYVGVGVFLVFSIGAPLAAAHSPWLKLVMGASFAVALSLVVFAGAELFTGLNMVMPIGCWLRKASVKSLVGTWTVSWIGNLLGAVLLAILLVLSGVLNGGPEAALVQGIAVKKMHLSIIELITRGLLCNMLVCLAVWCTFRMQSEVGKLVMIFWCLYAFVATGFEHSVANMTLLSLALLQHPLPEFAAHLSWHGLVYNLCWVSVGNALGGALFVAGAYKLASGQLESHQPVAQRPAPLETVD